MPARLVRPKRGSGWTTERLAALFARYNARYWRGRLPRYRMRIASGDDWLGLCERKPRRISIDVAAHASDRAVRATFLHEMAHAADRRGTGPGGHGVGFLEQMERLLAARAPVTFSTPEVGGMKWASAAVPARFRRCRAAALASQQRLVEDVERRARAAGREPRTEVIDERYIIGVAVDLAEIEGFTSWATARLALGQEYGLLDVQGRPTAAWAARVLPRARAAFMRALRETRALHRFRAGRDMLRGKRLLIRDCRLRCPMPKCKHTVALGRRRDPADPQVQARLFERIVVHVAAAHVVPE